MTIHLNNGPDLSPVAFRSQPTSISKQEIPEGAGDPMVVVALRRVLSDAISLYLRAHGYHWNVVGSDFSEYHSLFESIYSDIYESVDPIAENIRKMDGLAPFRLPELMALRSIVDQPLGSLLPAVMVADLLVGNEQMLACLNDAFSVATAANQQGIANFIAERIDQHQKWSWQLRSSLSAS